MPASRLRSTRSASWYQTALGVSSNWRAVVLGPRGEAHHAEVLEEGEPRVGGQHAVALPAALAVGGERADVRAAQHLLSDTRHGEVLAGLLRRVVGLHVEDSDVEARHLAGDLAAHGNRDGRPRFREADVARVRELERRRAEVQQAHAHAQRVGVLDEELPLLREEQAEAREVHLLRVHLGLREVGAHREIGGECRGGLPLEVVDADRGDAARAGGRRDRIDRLAARAPPSTARPSRRSRSAPRCGSGRRSACRAG